jgi:restriction endonuclease S subunit
MSTTEQKIQALADLILTQTKERLTRAYPDGVQASWEKVEVKPGPKYTKIDRGPEHNMSGMLMVENATGLVYGIKGYGKVHKGHFYGTLDTTDEWYWGEYYPRKRAS